MENKLNYCLILLYLVIGFIPNLGAVDRIATHWLYLNLISVLSIVFFIYKSNSKEGLKISSNKPLMIFLIFFIWSILSLFYSINIAESLISLIRLFSVILATYLIGLHLMEIKSLKLIFILFFFPILIIEILLPSFKFFQIISYVDYSFAYANDLKTFTPNKNITAAIITSHLGFIFFIKYYLKKFEWLLLILVFIASCVITFISARASIIGLVLSLLLVYIITFLKKKENLFFLRKVILVVGTGFFLSSLYLGSNNDASIQNRLTSINTDDTSTNQRIRFYKHGIKHMINNPIIGIGIGNWKFKSIEYDSKDIQSYIVPYHLHNDFLQYGAETGFIGMFLYLLLFLILLLINIQRIDSNYFLSVSLIISVTVFFVDSNLNFPHHRPIMMILLAFIIALTELNRVRNIEK